MLATLTDAKDRALWATALCGGLRCGELQGLRREDVDLAIGVIRVERGWDHCEGECPAEVEARPPQGADPGGVRDRLAEYVFDGPESGRIYPRRDWRGTGAAR